MDQKIGEMYAELSIRDQKYYSGMAAAQKQAVIFAGQVTGVFGQLRGTLSTIVAALAVRQVAGFFGEAISQAGNYQDTLNRTKAVLKGSADIVIKESERMADSLGVVKTEYLSAASSFAAAFKGAGFGLQESAEIGNKLTKLGMDLASFANTTNEDAFGALQAALRGEFDPIERYNVFISAAKIETEAFSMGIIKSKKELDDHAKRMATLSLIMAQTKDAQDDLTSTLDEQNNAVKRVGGIWTNFMTDLGQSLQPAVAGVIPELSRAATELAGFVKDHQADIKAMAEVIGTDLVGALQAVSGLAHQNIENFKALAAAWEAAPPWVKGLIGGGGIGAAMGATGATPGGLFAKVATADIRASAAEAAALKAGRGRIEAGLEGMAAFAGRDSDLVKDIAPDELSENQKRHKREEAERQRIARINAPILFNPPPAAAAAPGFAEEIARIAQRNAQTQQIVGGLLGVIPGVTAPRVRGPGDLMRPAAEMSPEVRESEFQAGRLPLGQLTTAEQIEALQKQRGTIESLMPKEPARSSQMFQSGESMEQSFQQKILEQTDKQDEANKLLKEIDRKLATLNETQLKKAKDTAYAMIAPASAARR
jgi:hypothetical protein